MAIHSMESGSDVPPVATPTRTLKSTVAKRIPLYEVRDNAHCLILQGMIPANLQVRDD
jgi:hypothetical protein